MKMFFRLVFFYLVTSLSLLAQAPQKFSYQTVIRNSGGQLLTNQQVGIKISVLQGTENGIVVFAERHIPTTNANGLASLQIGTGTVLNGSFSNINWSQGPYFISTETDPNGGTTYTIVTTQQLLSVPYALYAETSGNSIPGPQGLTGPQGPQGEQGLAGQQGPIGLTGPAGPQGATGTTGSQGPIGLTGPQGPAGPQGQIGANGAQGQTGLTGPQGPAGQNGAVGPQGPIGPQGPQGNPATDDQQLSVSETGDTLFLQGGGFVIVPGISAANNSGSQTGISAHNCGATNVHNPAKTYGTMTDQQGNVYNTIVIGAQEWMAENLRTTVYRNGNEIANVTDGNQWANLTTGAWCYYNNNSQYECPYGKLYNWYTVADPRNVCPTGWHLPNNNDWFTLINLMGGISLAGGNLKNTGYQYWLAPNEFATNEYGFSGLPGGSRDYGPTGIFSLLGNNCFLWSSSENNLTTASFYYFNYYDGTANQSNSLKQNGFSIRCLRD